MIVLDNVNRTLQVVLAGAKNTNDCPVVAAWNDQPNSTGQTGTKLTPGENPTKTNGVTAVTLVSAPSAGYLRRITSIAMNNADLASVTVSFQYNDNGTTYVLYKITLQTLEQLIYEEGYGFVAYDANGAVKSQASTTSSATSTASSIAGAASSQASSIAALTPASVSSQASSMAALTPASVSSQASSIAAGIVVASINSVSSQASSMAALTPASVSSQASSVAATNPGTVSSLQSAASVQSFTSTNWSTASSTVSRVKSSFSW